MELELAYFFAAVQYGILTAFFYHAVLFFRAMVRHSVSVTDAEDILFFGAAGVAFFLVAYRYNYGILRWYGFAGAGIGAWCYTKLPGAVLERVRKWLLQKQRKTYKMKQRKKQRKKQTENHRESIADES